jgi:hypothetical protein
MRLRRAERLPNDMSILVRRMFGMVGATVPSDCGSYHSVPAEVGKRITRPEKKNALFHADEA